MYEYNPTGKKNIGRPRNRWSDQQSCWRKKPGCFKLCCCCCCYCCRCCCCWWW